jgi:hypothetical protein
VGDFRQMPWDKPIDLLFIDGKQYFKEALDTFNKFKKYIKIGGFIIIRDYLTKAADHEHGRFVDEVLFKDEHYDIHIEGQVVWAKKIMTVDEINKVTEDIVSFDMRPEDTEVYKKYIAPLPQGSIVVDFGTGEAKNAIRMALCNPGAEIWTWDWGKGNPDSVSHVYFKRLIDLIHRKDVKNIYFTTSLSDQAWADWNWPISVLNIDCSHDGEQTRKDIERWLPCVVDKGYIFIHDYNYPGSEPYKFPELRSVVQELLGKYKFLEYLGGTQVIQKCIQKKT